MRTGWRKGHVPSPIALALVARAAIISIGGVVRSDGIDNVDNASDVLR